MNDPRGTDPVAAEPGPDAPHAQPAADASLEQRAIAWLFGDDEEDPGLIAEQAAARPEFDGWLDAFAVGHAELKSLLVPHADNRLPARIAALRADIQWRRGNAPDWPTARADTVRSLAAARSARAGGSAGRRPSLRTRAILVGGLLLATAAALLLVFGRAEPPPQVDARIATVLVAELAPDGGMGFAGAASPSARDRGFLLGAVLDLSRPRGDGAPAAPSELTLARALADRALKGLDAPADAEAQRVRVVAGCGAILVDAAERSACEQGLADYIARRDAFFARR